MPISPNLTEQMLEALRGSGKAGRTHTISLSVGGYVEVVTNEADATMMGLFNEGIDGQVQDLCNITTEPVHYNRVEYVHDEKTEIKLHDASGVVDAFFMVMGDELIAYDRLATARDLENLDSIKFEEPLIRIK